MMVSTSVTTSSTTLSRRQKKRMKKKKKEEPKEKNNKKDSVSAPKLSGKKVNLNFRTNDIKGETVGLVKG